MARTRPQKADLIAETMAAMRAFQTAVDEVDEQVARRAGINRTDLRCLDDLTREDSLSAGELAARTGLTTGAMTLVIDRLEEAGLVRRIRDSADRRRVRVQATAKARRLIGGLYGELGEVARKRLEAMPVSELRVVSAFLERARELNEAHAEHLRDRGPRRAAGRRRGPMRTS